MSAEGTNLVNGCHRVFKNDKLESIAFKFMVKTILVNDFHRAFTNDKLESIGFKFVVKNKETMALKVSERLSYELSAL